MKKKLTTWFLLFSMLVSILIPYQTAFAAISQNNGVDGTGRYVTFSILEGAIEYQHPRPILFEGINTNTINLKGRYEAQELDGEKATMSYQIISANGEAYHEGIIEEGIVGNAEFPSSGNIDFNLTLQRDTGACSSTPTVVCVDAYKQNYAVLINVDYEVDEGTQQFMSASKTIFVDGNEDWDEKDTYNYDSIDNALEMKTHVLKDDGSIDAFKNTSNIMSTELNAKPMPLYIEGFYQPESSIAVGKEIDIRYDILAIDQYSPMKVIQSFKQTVYTGEEGSRVYFNKKLHISKKEHEGKPEHTGFMDTVFLENEPHAYIIQVTAQVAGETEPRKYAFQQLYVSEGQTIQALANINMNLHQTIPTIPASKHLTYTLKEGSANVTTFNMENIKANAVKTDLFGSFNDVDIPVGSEVVIKAQAVSIIEPYQEQNEIIVKNYIQNNETKDYPMEFNKRIYFKAESAKAPEDNGATIYLKDYPGDYVFNVSIEYIDSDGKKHLSEQEAKNIKVVDASYTNPNYVFNTTETVPNVAANKYLSGFLVDDLNNEIRKLYVSNLRSAEGQKLYLKGGISNPTIPIGEEVRLEYAIKTVGENFLLDTDELILTYEQNQETKDSLVGFNKEIYFKTGEKVVGDTKPTIYLKDYEGDYYIEMTLYFDKDKRVRDKVYWQFSVDGQGEKIDQKIKGEVPFERNETYGADFVLNKIERDASSNITLRTPFKEATVNSLTNTPMELEISGSIDSPNTVVSAKQLKIGYDIVAIDEYSKNKVIKRYLQSFDTKNNEIDFHRKFFLSTEQNETTNGTKTEYIYLENEPHPYIVRVFVEDENGYHYLKDWQIDITNDSNNKIRDVNLNLHQKIPVPALGSKVGVSMKKEGMIEEFNAFNISEVNVNHAKIDLLGSFKDTTIATNTNMLIQYSVSAMDVDYDAKENALKTYVQTENTRLNSVEYNKGIYFKTKSAKKGTDNPATIYLEDYPNNYVFKVEVYSFDTEGNKTLIEQVSRNFAVTNTTYVQPNYLIPDYEKEVETFTVPTKFDIRLQRYVSENSLDSFISANAATIKQTPLKLNIGGVLQNNAVNGTEVAIEYEITSLEDYTKESGVNTLIRKYIQNPETRTQHLEVNKDIFITTKSRSDKSGDDTESTIYLDDETRYYTLTVTVKSSGDVFIKRNIIFKINGTGIVQQPIEGPEFTPNAPLDTFVTNPYNLGERTKKLEFTARELNTKKAIDVDVFGFVNKSWINDEVAVRYELTALNTYTDYINGNGITSSLTLDPHAQAGDNVQNLMDPMVKWYGGTSQNELLQRYVSTEYTQGNYAAFKKPFTIRTKLDLENYKNDPSTFFLDNAARDYKLKIIAKNMNTGETLSEILDIKISTSDIDENVAPQFDDDSENNIAITSPSTDSEYWQGDPINITWKKAIDADDTDVQTEYSYYKIYYYYTQDAYGQPIPEVQRYMGRYDDMPEGSFSTLSTSILLDTSNRIEPAYLRIVPCDINHVCGDATHGNPIIFNSYRSNPGDGGGNPGGGGTPSTGGGGPAAMITINPKPTGQWTSESIDTFVTYEGDLSLLSGATKYYAVSNSSTVPTGFNTLIPADGKITLASEGEYFIHAKYILTDDTVIYTTAGPYKIYKQKPVGFTMTLKDTVGNIVTTWNKNDLRLEMTYSGNATTEGIKMEYRVEGYHTEWQKYEPGVLINVEGSRKIYGRAINKSGLVGETKTIQSAIDKSASQFKKAILTKQENGTYDATVVAIDGLSGIKKLTLDTGLELKPSGSTNTYMLNGMTIKPTNVKAIDNAGNELTILFGNVPNVAFEAGYDPTKSIRKSVEASISGGVDLSYKKGNQLFICTTDPCLTEIERNTLLTGINTDGYKQSFNKVRINNIDKSELNLLLDGQRDAVDENKLILEWNYNLINGTLYCYEGGEQKTFSVAGTGVVLAGLNTIYDCYVKGEYAGENLTSNRVVINPDQSKPITGGDASDIEVKEDIYVEESRSGTSYFINTKRSNTEDNYVPIPAEAFN